MSENRQAIMDTVYKLFLSTDRLDWPAVRDCYSDEVKFDMGEEPVVMTSQAITDGS